MSEAITFRQDDLGGVYLLGQWPEHARVAVECLESHCEFQWRLGRLHIEVDNAVAEYDVEGTQAGDLLLQRVYGKRR